MLIKQHGLCCFMDQPSILYSLWLLFHNLLTVPWWLTYLLYLGGHLKDPTIFI